MTPVHLKHKNNSPYHLWFHAILPFFPPPEMIEQVAFLLEIYYLNYNYWKLLYLEISGGKNDSQRPESVSFRKV